MTDRGVAAGDHEGGDSSDDGERVDDQTQRCRGSAVFGGIGSGAPKSEDVDVHSDLSNGRWMGNGSMGKCCAAGNREHQQSTGERHQDGPRRTR